MPNDEQISAEVVSEAWSDANTFRVTFEVHIPSGLFASDRPESDLGREFMSAINRAFAQHAHDENARRKGG